MPTPTTIVRAPGRPTSAPPTRRTRLFALSEVRWATASTLLFALAALGQLAGLPLLVTAPLYAACYLTGGWEPALAGLRALRERSLDVDLLMIVAALGAAAIGQVLDGGLLIVIFATSGALEALATARTEDSVRGLLDLAPEHATVLDGDAERVVRTAELVPGDVILVRPGDRVGADGVVVDGASDVDQATITGEPLPVARGAGDEVFAGTHNGAGALRVRVARPAAESVVARIAELVEQATRTKAKAQLFIERIEQRYSVGVVVATLALFFGPLALGGALRPTLLRAMTFMIVASPCAVVLATMPPLLAAIANAGRRGVLVKSATVMERLGTATAVAFDKTGTLTRGTPWLAETRVLQGFPLTEAELLALAAAAELPSEHPVGAAVVRAARAAGLAIEPAAEFASAPGKGVTALVGGRRIEVGSPAHLAAPLAATVVAELEAAGHTAVLVLVDGSPAGVLGVADRARPDARAAVAGLAELTGATPVLLTGDNERAARRLADEVGITDVRAGLLPADKVAAIEELAGAEGRVLAVGDGVNDAPALAAAHVGIAMGGTGSDLTLRTADAVVVRDSLLAVPAVVALSRRARRVVLANLVIAATFITGLVVWDLVGHLPLPLGVAGHEGSTVVVGLNGLRLLGGTRRRRAGAGSRSLVGHEGE